MSTLSMPCRCLILFAAWVAFGLPSSARSAEGDPIAVKVWPGGVVSVHSHWGLNVVVNALEAESTEAAGPADQTITATETSSQVLSRAVNEAEPKLETSDWTVGSLVENQIGVQVVADQFVRVQVDGINVVVGTERMMADAFANLGPIDVFLGVTNSGLNNENLQQIRMLVPLKVTPATSAQIEASPKANVPILRQNHNTIALVAFDGDFAASTEIRLVTETPWPMPDDMNEMFVAMENACSESQEVFAALSAEQMNFRPANGTHTPRWNAEHMMATQLRFFSAIYHAIDDTIPVMNMSPKQMPADYQFANPDWTGAEEARQMKRVSDFCRRFAYLLDGIALDDRAPGSRWPSLKALLAQMDRHYSEHTANVVQKSELPGWPK